MVELRKLLDLKNIAVREIENRFEEIAKLLFQSYHIVTLFFYDKKILNYAE